MNRSQLLWLQGWIALSGAVFWVLPPALPYHQIVVCGSAGWALLCLASIWLEDLEDWAHRLSSFFGFLLCTMEGIMGVLGLTSKSGLLVMAGLHGLTFFLSVAGKYQSRMRRRPRRNFDQLAEDAVAEIMAKSGD
jgi:hypothetical protein